MSHCAYFAIINRLPTRDRCLKWNKKGETICLLCKNETESTDHLFFDCTYSKHIWFIVKTNLKINQNQVVQNIRESISYIQNNFKEKSKEFKKASIMLTTSLFHIWKERNQRLHSQKETDSIQLWKKIDLDSQIIFKKARNHRNQSAQSDNSNWNMDNHEDYLEIFLQYGKTTIDSPSIDLLYPKDSSWTAKPTTVFASTRDLPNIGRGGSHQLHRNFS